MFAFVHMHTNSYVNLTVGSYLIESVF